MQVLFMAWLLPVLLLTSPGPDMELEAASVKPNTTLNGVSGGCRGIDSQLSANDPLAAVPIGRCRIVGARLGHLVMIAYDLPQMRQVRGEADLPWGNQRFDIEGAAEDASTATRGQLLLMLQSLLAERFRLTIHRESIDQPGHALIVGKNGSKLRKAGGDGETSITISGAAINKFDAMEGRRLDRNMIMGRNVSIAQLTNALSLLPDGGPMLDKTGLGGAYDFNLNWEPGESISSVLQEQLGLRLESQMVPVDFVVIDSARRPTED
jgi:uncharacterized protein (TIGR03435 family)